MAAEWLRADQVAAIAARWQGPHDAHSPYWPQITDVAQLLAQDGRWRALVGSLATTLAIYANPEHWFATECSCSNPNCTSPDVSVIELAGSQTAADALAKAQAALDGGDDG